MAWTVLSSTRQAQGDPLSGKESTFLARGNNSVQHVVRMSPGRSLLYHCCRPLVKTIFPYRLLEPAHWLSSSRASED